MTRNPIGLLELALEISTAKANGCDGGDCVCGECELPLAADDDCLGGGDCSCGESEDCLAKGWEKFVPAQPKQPAQPKPIL
jgi:hypothetical protein